MCSDLSEQGVRHWLTHRAVDHGRLLGKSGLDAMQLVDCSASRREQLQLGGVKLVLAHDVRPKTPAGRIEPDRGTSRGHRSRPAALKIGRAYPGEEETTP
jgi:hypothetical protein